jgi:ABC-type glucose/galactose transport system permease subunit
MACEAGINGLYYKIFDASGSTIEGGQYYYGSVNGQFNNLGSLYTTYRMDKLELSVTQSSTWASVNQTPIVSTVDAVGGGVETDLPHNISFLTRSKNF